MALRGPPWDHPNILGAPKLNPPHSGDKPTPTLSIPKNPDLLVLLGAVGEEDPLGLHVPVQDPLQG